MRPDFLASSLFSGRPSLIAMDTSGLVSTGRMGNMMTVVDEAPTANIVIGCFQQSKKIGLSGCMHASHELD